MPLSSAARAGEAEAARGWGTHTGRPGRTPRRSCWGRLPGSERRASWRTEPTHSALAWGRVPSSPGAFRSLAPWPGSWRQGEAQPWGTQAQSDVSGRSAHVPGARRRVHGPLGHPRPGIELLSCGLLALPARVAAPPCASAIRPSVRSSVQSPCSFSVCTARPVRPSGFSGKAAWTLAAGHSRSAPRGCASGPLPASRLTPLVRETKPDASPLPRCLWLTPRTFPCS